MRRSPPTYSPLIILPTAEESDAIGRAVCVQTTRLPHSRLWHFPFPSHSLPASSLPLGGLEPPHPCPLGCRRKLYTNSIRQVIAILALPRVRGTVNDVAAFSADYFKLAKGQVPLDVVHTYIRPYVNNIYSARVPMHFPFLTDAGPRICLCGFFRNTSSYAIRASSTVILASADVASF